MCGICGIVDHSGAPIDPSALNRMRDAMGNRGPDDAGTHIIGQAGLAHRRLSIIDLSQRGRQPMTNEDGTVWLVFNGEIYDFLHLRQELLRGGHVFVSDSDSEVLVHGYEEWGIEGLAERINGMFAFAIWDAPKRRLHLVRDRLGKKPLYYGWRQRRFVFASELKALWTLAPGEWKVRPQSIARFLYWSYLPGVETCYEDVYQVLPAHILTLTTNGHHESRYWRLTFSHKTSASIGDVIEETDAILTAAVRRRLRSDVPLGAFLSGGVDSSYIVQRMADGAERPVRTFSMGTRDEAHDERGAARRVAELCGTDHVEFEVTADAWGLLPRLVWEFGQPFADPACIPTYYVAKEARRHVTVALTGDGGDESFAGYSQHQARAIAALCPSLPQSVASRMLEYIEPLLDDGGGAIGASGARLLRYAHPDPLVHWAGTDHWVLHHMPMLWRPQHRDLASRQTLIGFALTIDDQFDGTSALDRALHHDLHVLLPFCYNVKLDVATMMTSLEARSPFQDREVVEWAAKLPTRVKLRPWERKSLLKRVAARRLPHDVVYRRKHGFSLPVDAWFRGPWAAAAHDVIFSDQARDRGYFDFAYLQRLWTQHQSGTARHGMRFWSILWLELWFRMFVERTMSATSHIGVAGEDVSARVLAARA